MMWRLAAVNQIAEIFESHITGLFFNVLLSLVPDGRNGAGAGQAAKLLRYGETGRRHYRSHGVRTADAVANTRATCAGST